jgi:3-oxoacyl-[acyl-carrier-protein] synthase-3
MARRIYSQIIGTGSFVPSRKVPNDDFLSNEFYDPDGTRLERPNEETIEKFESITGIRERRYATDDLLTSDIAYLSAKDAIESAQIDKESLDYIVVAHNFGDVAPDNKRSDFVPTLASRVKYHLGIDNPETIAYDLPFGCPGWLQGMIQADYFIRSGDAKRMLIIGAEILSRVSDPHDRDSMIYGDGAGATIVEGVESDSPTGIISHCARTDTKSHAFLLRMGESYRPQHPSELLLKMQGHAVYQYALRTVPRLVKKCLAKAGITLSDVSKVLLHQANAKMDDAILERLYKMFGSEKAPEDVMPLTINWLGNSSVATIPTLLDLILKGRMESHQLLSGQNIVFASVGAGMNINAMVYRMP